MNELIAPCALLDDHTVLTKLGDIFSVLELKGVDAECLEPEAIDQICHRFDGALRILGPEYRVLQYLIKRDNPTIQPASSQDSIEKARTGWIRGRSERLYSVKLFLVVLRMRPIEERTKLAFFAQFSARQTLNTSRQDLKREMEQLTTAVNSLCVQLEGTIRPTRLDAHGTVRFLRSLVNASTEKHEPHGTLPMYHLDQYLPQSGMQSWKDHLTQDDYTIRMLSMIDPPSQTFPHVLRGLLQISSNMIICTQWKRESNATARREIDKKRRHYHLAKTSMWSSLGNSNPRPDEILVDGSKESLIRELDVALTAMERDQMHFGRFSCTIAVFDEDTTALRQATAKVIEVFATHDATVIEEHLNLQNAWASLIPGNYAYNLRQMWLMNPSYADLSFLFAPLEGDRINQHLNAPSLALVESRDSTLYHLNLHVQDVGHTVVLGSIGSGKSFLVNFLTASYQKYNPYTVIFDLGGSYKRLTSHYGGGYLHIGKESAVTINPFCLEPTAENLEFLFSFVRVLIERSNSTMPPEERKDLHRAITDLYTLDEDVRTLQTLAQTCKRSYSRKLDEWVGTGRLAGYFDHVEDNLTLSRFQTFDFEGMDKPEVLEPLLFYILHRANATIYDPNQHDVPKLVVFDEAWRFFKNQITHGYIHEALKTWRKRNAAMILATQSGDDLQRSQLLPTIAESCMTRFFLANPGMDAPAYREAFGLNSTEAGLIARLVPKREFLLKQPTGAKVLNLYTDPGSYRVFANKD